MHADPKEFAIPESESLSEHLTHQAMEGSSSIEQAGLRLGQQSGSAILLWQKSPLTILKINAGFDRRPLRLKIGGCGDLQARLL
jgi:hypothetical protein